MRLKSVLTAGFVLGALAFPPASALAFDVVPAPPAATSGSDEPAAAFARREGEYLRSFKQQDAFARQNPPTQVRGTTMSLFGGRVSGEDLAAPRYERDPNSIAPADPRDHTCWDCEQELVDGLWVLKPRR